MDILVFGAVKTILFVEVIFVVGAVILAVVVPVILIVPDKIPNVPLASVEVPPFDIILLEYALNPEL